MSSGRSEIHSGALLKTWAIENVHPPDLWDVLKVYTKMSLSHYKIEHVMDNVINAYD